jgi:hypothetical protein
VDKFFRRTPVMDERFAIYSAIKRLLYQYNLVPRTKAEEERFLRELIGVLKV